ncbi:ABC transporter permease [Microcella sp.]|uniref:ABC transporter permease n=1 Tax=Microcella sp. TaxID=1913979 RepID=UPI003F71E608
MVDHVLRLKLALLGSAFRPGATLARTLAVIVLAIAVGSAIIVLSGAIDVRLASHRAGLVIVASSLALAVAVAPLSAGLGSALEPRRFASFPIEPRRLAVSLAAAGAVGLPGVLAAVLGIGLERAWAGTPTAGAAIVAGVLAAVAIILISQYLVAVGAQLAVSPSARRLVTGVARAVIVIALAAATTTVLAVRAGGDDDILIAIARTLANTPLGMLWAVPASALAPLLARLLGGAIMIAVLVWGWGWIVARLVEAPQRPRSAATTTGLGWFDLVPATPAGVIAARSLLYWTRDARYRAVLLALPVAPVIMMLAFAVAGAPLPPLWLVPLPVLALFLGWFAHNDVAYDHTAVWMHVAAPVPGAADRWGRCVPPLLLGVPLVLVLAPLFALWSGVDGVLPALIGVSLGLLLTGLGVASVSSAIGAYPAARPGAGPFDQPPTLGARAGWTQSLALLATLAFMAPALTAAIWGFTSPVWFAVAGIAGAATGVGMLLLGIVIGGRAFRRRAPELLDLVLRT